MAAKRTTAVDRKPVRSSPGVLWVVGDNELSVMLADRQRAAVSRVWEALERVDAVLDNGDLDALDWDDAGIDRVTVRAEFDGIRRCVRHSLGCAVSESDLPFRGGPIELASSPAERVHDAANAILDVGQDVERWGISGVNEYVESRVMGVAAVMVDMGNWFSCYGLPNR